LENSVCYGVTTTELIVLTLSAYPCVEEVKGLCGTLSGDRKKSLFVLVFIVSCCVFLGVRIVGVFNVSRFLG